MKRYFAKLIFLFCLISMIMLVGCNAKKDIYEDISIKKLEISKITFENEETFDLDKMKVGKNWTFTDSKSIKVIWNNSVVGSLEPKTEKPSNENYNTYYIKMLYKDNSIEEWIFWLDKQFKKDGYAENKANKGIYKLLSKKDVTAIGQLLKE